jgi:predicted small secreted protein
MNQMQRVVLVVMAVLLSGLLAGCGTTVEIGFNESVQPGKWQATYEAFTGTKSQGVQASAGQTLTLKYTAVVDRGSLEIKIQDATAHVLWDATIFENAQESVQLQVFQTGQYTIIVHGAETGGSFDISWEAK